MVASSSGVSTRGLSGAAKAAARREQNRINKAAQRARDRAGTKASRPGPPRVRGTADQRAAAIRDRQAARRAEVLRSLPDVRNPLVNIRVPETDRRGLAQRKTREGQQRQASRIKAQADASRIQDTGRARKRQIVNELSSGPQSERLRDAMDDAQAKRFQTLADKIAGGSQQSTAIMLDHAGGINEYNAALEKILASPESRDVEEGLSQMKALAERAERAEKMYGPKALGRRLTV